MSSQSNGDSGAAEARSLVGRAETIAGLEARLLGPEPGGVVLAGPAGVGRTAVARALVRLAGEHAVDTAFVTGTRAAARVPLAAMAPLLPADPAREVGDRAWLLRRTLGALAERARDRRLLLVVDDAHLLDDASATLVHHVAAVGTAAVLATVRAGEPAPDPVVALWKDELCLRVELGPLGPDGTGELVRDVLGGPVDPASVVQLAARSQGNVLFLRELVAAAVDDGRLRDDGGIWRLEGELTPSTRLTELVEATDLAGLGDDERALLEVVALGEPVGAAELEALADPALAEDLERRGLLAGEQDGDRLRVHIAQPLVGDVVRARTPALRARAIAETLAGAAARRDSTDHDDVLRLATLGLSSGEPDPDVLLDGAAIARDRADLPRAEALARAAADAGAGFDAALLAAQAAALQGRLEEADADLAELMAGAADDRERSRAALARFDTAVVWSARDEGDVLGRAAAAVDDPAWHDRLAARRLALVLLAEGPRATLDAAAVLPGGEDPEAADVARIVRADALVRSGRLDEALSVIADPAPAEPGAATGEEPTWAPWWHAVVRASALVHAGRYAEADGLAASHHAAALARGAVDAQAAFAVLEPTSVADRGGVRTAAARAREALALHRRLGRDILVRRDLIASALAHALAGDGAAAAGDLAELDALDLPPVRRDQADLLQARAWAAVAVGDLPRASGLLEKAAERGERWGDLVGAAAALHALARLGRAAAVRERLASVAAQVDGELVPARLAHTEALAAGDAAALGAASVRFEDLGADLLAAEAAADAAVAHQRAGDRRLAAAAARRSSELAARAEDPVTPGLHAVETRAVLTPAERETAVLAANGRANKEIAEQLHLSPRTVENRLQRVYDKLGVAGRGELADALAPAGSR
ncbi:MAG TPA: LuxR C-terminal-related transcriptional regulator [Acidimicrobiales bacterium]|nr:LuxR C-terminal-related transcriptional regulator [Acidimicrobiales bacterium]